MLELLAAQTVDGPCQDCLHTGTVVTSTDLATETSRWPRFAPAADYHGYRAASAVPMRLRGQNNKHALLGVTDRFEGCLPEQRSASCWPSRRRS